jgi:hypothetical protein
MQGLGQAFKTLPTTKRHNVSKMIYGWLNTGHQRVKIEPNAKSNCPRCSQADETQEHMLTCGHGSARASRYNALTTLRSEITTSCGGSKTWDILHDNLKHWTDGNTEKIGISEKYMLRPDLRAALHQAIDEQGRIGWHFAIRGFLSTSWTVAYQCEHPKSSLAGTRQKWLRRIIKSLWTFNFAMWESRNKVLHSKQESNQHIRASHIDARITYMYSQKGEFAVTDHSLFGQTLEQRLSASIRTKTNWLVLVARYHPTTRNRKSGNQELMTKYYARKQSTISTQMTQSVYANENDPSHRKENLGE